MSHSPLHMDEAAAVSILPAASILPVVSILTAAAGTDGVNE